MSDKFIIRFQEPEGKTGMFPGPFSVTGVMMIIGALQSNFPDVKFIPEEINVQESIGG